MSDEEPVDGHEQELATFYADADRLGLAPLWTQTAELMPVVPSPQAKPHVWRWAELLPVLAQAGRLVPVGRGGERRAMALANPALRPLPYATPTLWAALQYLGPGEVAPSHRHSQGAFRFVLEGEGAWTVVDGDPVAMRPGDLLLTPGMAWHEHHNSGTGPMVWLDGLDIPLVRELDAGFFEPGADTLAERATPPRSRSERLWGHAGLRPLALGEQGEDTWPLAGRSPLVVYRWEETDAALAAQAELASAADAATLGPGHVGVRFVNPATGRDALPTMRLEVHRLAADGRIPPARHVGSAVWQVLHGAGTVEVDGLATTLAVHDAVAVPSWARCTFSSAEGMDLVVVSDAPVYEALHLDRSAAG
jgi:gentisate 1,2-dioxygenase